MLETTNALYGLDVDTEPLQSLASDVHQHYQRLAERVEQVDEGYRPEDQMFMCHFFRRPHPLARALRSLVRSGSS